MSKIVRIALVGLITVGVLVGSAAIATAQCPGGVLGVLRPRNVINRVAARRANSGRRTPIRNGLRYLFN